MSTPAWLFAEWHDLFAEQATQVAEGMLQPEPLWLRAYHPGAKARLEQEDCEVTAGPVAGSLAVRISKPLGELTAFTEGLVQPQNPSSMLPVIALNAQPEERVFDLASGNGIKAAQIAATGAHPISIEIDARKVKRAKKNLRRLGFEAEHHVQDLTLPVPLAPASKVLLDAPCSGTGTLRGNPEIKLRLTRQDVHGLAALQTRMLTNAATLTTTGGTLVYAVCALTRVETLDVVQRFLQTHAAFKVSPVMVGVPHVQTEVGTFILPFDGLDGFFISRLIKQA